MQIADPPAFSLSGRNVAKSRNREYLDSLKKLILSMHFLGTNVVVGVKECFGIFEFELSVPLSGENRSNKASGVPSNTSHAFGFREHCRPCLVCNVVVSSHTQKNSLRKHVRLFSKDFLLATPIEEMYSQDSVLQFLHNEIPLRSEALFLKS